MVFWGPNGEALAPVMSADGDHAIWQYNNYNGAFGLGLA